MKRLIVVGAGPSGCRGEQARERGSNRFERDGVGAAPSMGRTRLLTVRDEPAAGRESLWPLSGDRSPGEEMVREVSRPARILLAGSREHGPSRRRDGRTGCRGESPATRRAERPFCVVVSTTEGISGSKDACPAASGAGARSIGTGGMPAGGEGPAPPSCEMGDSRRRARLAAAGTGGRTATPRQRRCSPRGPRSEPVNPRHVGGALSNRALRGSRVRFLRAQGRSLTRTTRELSPVVA